MGESRLIAIGDIHGCATALAALLAVLDLRAEDTVITLGDYVDRGENSRGVVERLLCLHESCRHVPLLGNHELMVVQARESRDFERLWLQFGGGETVNSYAPRRRHGRLDDIPTSHWQFFLQTCKDWYETDHHLFVHAGVDPKRPLPDTSPDRLFWDRLTDRGRHYSGKTVVCGHTEQRGGVPLDLGHTVCIDTYAHGGGWLTALDVNSRHYWQATDWGDVRDGMLD